MDGWLGRWVGGVCMYKKFGHSIFPKPIGPFDRVIFMIYFECPNRYPHHTKTQQNGRGSLF